MGTTMIRKIRTCFIILTVIREFNIKFPTDHMVVGDDFSVGYE